MPTPSHKTRCNADLRRQMRAWRRQLPAATQQAAAAQASLHMQQLSVFQSSKSIGCYIAQEGELDPAPLIAAALAQGKHIYLAALHPTKEKQLSFLRYIKGDTLQPNKFDILEPNPHASCIDAWKLDLVILPQVAYDQHGNRLGRGAGYYDRTFSFVFELPNSKHPCLVGYGYAQQQVDQLEVKAWDVPMDYIITEESALSCIHNQP